MVKGTLEKAFGYQGDNMNLPVGDLAASLPFYETVLGFHHVKNFESLFAEFNANGLHKELSEIGTEHRDGAPWKVFYVVAPDGLCYWFGERQAG